MRAKLLTVLSVTALMSFGSIRTVYAQEMKAATQNHEEHHPEGKNSAKTADKSSDQSGMMGQMDMNQMEGMMHECMEMHKDGKMCDHDMMNNCQKQMSKADCQKMMKQAKAQEKSKKK